MKTFIAVSQLWRIAATLAALAVTGSGLAQSLLPPSAAGLWYDRTRSGHGLDLHRVTSAPNAQIFGALYTYAVDGSPEWLWIQTTDSPTPVGALSRIRSNQSVDTRNLTVAAVGDFSLSPISTCADGVARPGADRFLDFAFSVDGVRQRWCLEPALPANASPERSPAPTSMAALTGAWYSAAEPGWGLLAHYFERESTHGTAIRASFVTAYFYDASGHPRWAVSQGDATAFESTLNFTSLRAPCTGCAAGQAQNAGTGVLRLGSPKADALAGSNRVTLALTVGSAFNRTADLSLLSSPLGIAQTAATRHGLLRGTLLGNATERYFNIPYAAAPIGVRRWQYPAPVGVFPSLRLAAEPGPACPQVAGSGFFARVPALQSEDCLQLNIWRPASTGATRHQQRAPVMVWIHGGGMIQGSAVEDVAPGVLTYDGARYAGDGIVFVSINYRLGTLGYMALAGAVAEAGSAGNYGFADQIMALTWVRENIAAFGGDPDQITVFGESAGGVSVCALLANPRAVGLFHRAIVQSGNCLSNLTSPATALQQGERVSAQSSCATAADKLGCLRALPASTIVGLVRPVLSFSGQDGEAFGLINDGAWLTEPPAASLKAGRGSLVPVIMGVNDDETTTLLPAASLAQSVAGYEAAVRTRFPAIGNLVLGRYPASAYLNLPRAYQDIFDDTLFTCSARRAAADVANTHLRLRPSNPPPVYHYALTQVLADASLAPLESFHGLDIVLLFGERPNATADERRVANAMQSAWRSFARGGRPNLGAGAPTWPQYAEATRQSMNFNGTNLGSVSDYRGEYCRFWAQFAEL